MSVSDNKKVAKNTLILYARMIITMVMGMWTSRIVLNALGFTDQGLYNVVGGVIGFSSLITSSMSGSITRFITFEIGRGNLEKVNKAVQNGITVQWLLSAIVLLVGETLGLWFVNTQLVVPSDRIVAVNWVYQFALFNVIISLISSAPNALILAHEKMNVYAGTAIFSSVASLLIALAIVHSPMDRLILYSFLHFISALCVRIFYTVYLKWQFPYIKMKFSFDKQFFMPIFSFAGWDGIGTWAGILRGSGTSVLLNIFGGPIANTIGGIAGSVNVIATMFVGDFTTSYAPQIIKRYAAGEYSSLVKFINQCSKISYSLIAVMAVPVIFNVNPLLTLWLKEIPKGVGPFAILCIIFSMLEGLYRPLINAKCATGEIRNYQIVVGGIMMLTLPITYGFLKLGFPIYFSYVSILITTIAAFIARIVMLQGSIPTWSSWRYVTNTVFPCIMATLISLVIPAAMSFYLPKSPVSVIAQCVVGSIWTGSCLFLIAMSKSEKEAVINIVRQKFRISTRK
ncbi:MAG: lipopolysaccharide biosynthesis protein [Muribaculaceae bacterium]|nr:lipopolysaccharide biosynthesis protein [Muribaculaceae bacterium]